MREARLLPIDLIKVQDQLGYKSIGVPELEPAQIQQFNQRVMQHADSWVTLETETKELARQLDTFTGKFTGAGELLLNIIHKVDIERFLGGTIKELTEEEVKQFSDIKLDANQKKSMGVIHDYLKNMSEMTSSYVARAVQVSHLAAGFERTLTDELIPQTQLKLRAFKKSALSHDVKDQLDKVEALDELIKSLAQAYSSQVGYAFTGLLFGPIGLIVTGGVFGSQAENTRSEKNKAIEQRKELIGEIDQTKNILRFLEAAQINFSNLQGRMLAAEVGAKQLAQVWQYIYRYLEDASKSLDQIDNIAKLHGFALELTLVLKPWEQIGNYVEQISSAFNDLVE